MFVKHGMNQLSSSRNFTLSSSAVLRRQHFLIRSLAGGGHSNYCTLNRMQETNPLEADAENILRAITPSLDPTRHKGQAG